MAGMDYWETVLKQALERRKRGVSARNDCSSRSHAVLTIHCLNVGSKVHLVDLAGAERVHDERAKLETCNINRSLSALTKIIRKLANAKVNVHVPYRESTLTHLLRDSFAGLTAIITSLFLYPFFSPSLSLQPSPWPTPT
ncbi:hypothetical protein Ciccas_012496 [Cichlidogyrus casuarinus]|uniref:Kinesin motor domain-containing protein n=1 Tax=Cichlidogyrus casuarinus TaxID=1844966 RepID=A0ABD2PQ14_9PLAT